MILWQDRWMDRWTDKSYSYCCLHVIWCCFIFLWSFMKMSWMVFKLKSDNEMTIVKFQRGITPKMYRQELQVLWSAVWWCLIVLWSYMILLLMIFKLQSGHKITIVKFQRGITPKMYRQVLGFLWSACCLMMLYISMKFHENILNGFQVFERTRNDHWQISKGNNSKNVFTRVMVLVVCTSSDNALYFYEIFTKYL